MYNYFPKNPRAMYFATTTTNTTNYGTTTTSAAQLLSNPRELITYINTARATRFISTTVNRKTATTFYENHKKAVVGGVIGILLLILIFMIIRVIFVFGHKIRASEMVMLPEAVTAGTNLLGDEIVVGRGYRWDSENTRP